MADNEKRFLGKTEQNIFLSIMFAILLLPNFFNVSRGVGESMMPAINPGTISLYKYYISDINHGDIVSINTKYIEQFESNKNIKSIGKRVIGVPGDIVIFYKDNLYVNGVLQDEDYLLDNMQGNKNKITVLEDDEFYVLGDNRNNSIDSRDFGPIKGKWINSKYATTLYKGKRN